MLLDITATAERARTPVRAMWYCSWKTVIIICCRGVVSRMPVIKGLVVVLWQRLVDVMGVVIEVLAVLIRLDTFTWSKTHTYKQGHWLVQLSKLFGECNSKQMVLAFKDHDHFWGVAGRMVVIKKFIYYINYMFYIYTHKYKWYYVSYKPYII